MDQMEQESYKSKLRLAKKKKELAELVKHQMSYKFMIKRNKKNEDKL